MKKLILIAFFVLLSLPLRAQGPQWIVYKTSNSNIPTNSIYSIVFEGDTVWLGSDSGAIKLINNSWSYYSIFNSSIPSNRIYKIAVDNNGRKLMGTLDVGATVFSNGVWTTYNTSNSPLPYNIVFGVDFDLDNNMWMATPFGAAKTNGLSWEVYNSSTFPSLVNVNRVKIDPYSNVKYIGTNYRGLSVYNDTSWINYNNQNSGLSSDGIRDIEIDSNKDIWIATYDNGISRFNIQDSLWTRYLPGLNSLCIAVDTEKGNWVGTGGAGIFKFIGNTVVENFRPENSPLPSHAIRDLAYDRFGNLWIATGQGLAVFNENGVVSVNNISQNIPSTFSLNQNYPNPFNPTTKISFEIIKNSLVKLSVYDINGKLIKTLVDGEVNSGNHIVTFDASNLSTGIYFYKMIIGETVMSKKMMLVK